MQFMVEIGLFENTNGIISCLKMASRTDEYTQKLIQSVKKTPDNIERVSGQNPRMSVLIEKNRIDEIRLDKKIKPLRSNDLDDGFEEFWQAYPKKVGKEAARKSWEKYKSNFSLTSVLLALQWQIESDQWRRNDGQFIPNPATYLNQGRWQDQQPVESTPF